MVTDKDVESRIIDSMRPPRTAIGWA